MGALMRREQRDGQEVHISTGKLAQAGEEHVPEWGPWTLEWVHIEMRPCLHPDCDLDDVRKTGPT